MSSKPTINCSRNAALALFVLASPVSAHASIFHGETLDKVADIMSWVVLVIAPVIAITVFWLVHILPEKIAEKKQHPQAKAIQVLCLLSLVFGGMLWPLAWLWAYSKPVLHKLAYGTDKDESIHHDEKDRQKAAGEEEAQRLKVLRLQVAELEAIDRARNHIFLQNAYLYNNQMILSLVRARLRGVDVRVIMPGNNDMGAGHSSNLVTSNFLRRHGVRVYFYPGMSHVKALLVDGWVCFGSANFDSLSLRLNREGNIASSDPGFAARFRREVFETDFARARELKEDIAVDWSDHLSDVLLNPF